MDALSKFGDYKRTLQISVICRCKDGNLHAKLRFRRAMCRLLCSQILKIMYFCSPRYPLQLTKIMEVMSFDLSPQLRSGARGQIRHFVPSPFQNTISR